MKVIMIIYYTFLSQRNLRTAFFRILFYLTFFSPFVSLNVVFVHFYFGIISSSSKKPHLFFTFVSFFSSSSDISFKKIKPYPSSGANENLVLVLGDPLVIGRRGVFLVGSVGLRG